jgi:membrane fusion protein, copper/silver efflux system
MRTASIQRQCLLSEGCSLLILILVGLGACSKPVNPPGNATVDNVDHSKPGQFFIPVESQQQFGVRYSEVRRRQMRLRIRSFGTLDVDQAQIFECVSHVDGYIEELQVTSPGERVTVGQPLMAIYTPDLRSAEQQLASLLKVEESGNVPPASMTQLIDTARSRLRRMGFSADQLSELERTKEPTDLLQIRSPCDGIVSEAPLRVGLNVKHGDKLMGLLNLSRLWLWVNFYEDEVNLLKGGEPMTVVFPGLANQSFVGKVSVISPTIDPVKRTSLVRIDIPNVDGQLRPGMSANVTTDINAGEGLTVPFDSVLPTGSQRLVFVERGLGILEPRLIGVGRQSVECGDGTEERYYQVLAGLREGERVVSGGNFLIDAEAQVQGALRNSEEEKAQGSFDSDSPGPIGEK